MFAPTPRSDRRARLRAGSGRVRALLVALLGLVPVACAQRVRPPVALLEPPSPAAAAPYATDVRRLRSPDFAERSRAAARLARAGEDALPALGAAGPAAVDVPGGVRVSTTAPVLRAIFRDLPADRVRIHLSSPWATVRAAAADEAGRREGWAVIPDLLARMDDPDPGVRAAAAASVRRLTNRFFDYEAEACVAARRQALQRWRAWWQIEGRLGVDGERTAGQ